MTPISNIYIPIKWNRTLKYQVPLVLGRFCFRNIIKKYHRFLYFNKVHKIYQDVLENIPMNEISIVHAHSLFTDGAVALNLKRTFGIKYIVAVRLTDVVLQYRYMCHRRHKANDILLNASRIIFISDIYKQKLCSYLPKLLRKNVIEKSIIIPNGIHEDYLKVFNDITPYQENQPFELLFVGRIIAVKNIETIIKAVDFINKHKSYNVHLTIVGGGIPSEKQYYEKILSLVQSYQNIDYLGEINDTHEIIKLYSQSHMLVAPSHNELFGLVYIEAISQNTPFIYGENTGINPYVKNEEFAFPVHQDSYIDLVDKIEKCRAKYSEYSDFSNYAKKFSWKELIKLYKDIYEQL